MNELKNIINKYIDASPSQIDENMSLTCDLGIDSFSLISMVVEIEERFNVQIPEYELGRCQTLNDLYGYITSNANS